MKLIIAFALIAIAFWIHAYYCHYQRKFYIENAYELLATLISSSAHLEQKGKYNKAYYDLDVIAENGEEYYISTTNKKANNYETDNNITIIVPVQFNHDSVNSKFNNMIIIKDDLKTPAQFWLSVGMAVLFTICTMALIVLYVSIV